MGFPFLGKTSPVAEIDTPGVSNLRHMLAGIGGIFGANMGIIRYAYRSILYCMRQEVSFLAEYRYNKPTVVVLLATISGQHFQKLADGSF